MLQRRFVKHIKLTLQYDGTDYSGWQIQKKGKTIQGILEKTVYTVTGEHLRVTGASRTDAGVHAFQQVASFKTRSDLTSDVLNRAINANLPHDIRVISAEECSADFHPRYSAKNKTYSYLISYKGAYSVFLGRYSWLVFYNLDCDLMKRAARYFIGRHDFSSFRASGCSSKNSVRRIIDIQVSERSSFNFMTFRFNVPLIKITIKADAFLRHMVRNIVGTLVEVGRGRFSPSSMKEILKLKDRRYSGMTAPACGLFLEKIKY